MNYRAVGIMVLAAVLSGFLVTCSFNPEVGNTKPVASDAVVLLIGKKPSADNFQLTGKVKVDEFNDLAAGEDTPAQGGDVVVRFNAEPQTLSTWLSTSDAYSTYISSYYIYDALLWRNWETFQLEPGLAERWIEEDIVLKKDGSRLRGLVLSDQSGGSQEIQLKTSAGEVFRVPAGQVEEVRKGVAFTFYLRKNVRFHDGQPFTAADVKFSLDTIKNEHVDAPDLRIYYADVESCEILDPYTVRITYAKQYWKAREFAGGFEILPQHIYDPDNLQERDPEAFGKQFNASPYHRKPMGTGPYKFVRWDTGQQVVLERNKDYWNEPRRGHLERLIFRFISDPVAALQALKNGEVQFVAGRLTGEQYDSEMNDPQFLKKFAKVEFYTGGFCWTGWNMRRPPFDDVKVRQAMAYGALDLDQFLKEAMHGHGIRVAAYQYYFGPAYDHTLQPYPYDPAKAKQLLLEAGWFDRDGDGLRDKNGQPFRFEHLIPSGSDLTRRRVAIMKENLRRLGIDMTVRELEWATFLQNITDRKFDACYLCWATDAESDPYQIWHTSQSENRGSNYPGFGDAQTDHLIEESRRTLDPIQRRKLLAQLDRILYDQQPYLFLYLTPELGAYDKKYRGVKFYKSRPGYDLTEWFLPQSPS